MKFQSLCIILGSVLLTTGAQIALKIVSARYTAENGWPGIAQGLLHQLLDPLTIVAVIAYSASLLLWILALRQLPLSIAYSFSGLTIAFVTVSGVFLLDETISSNQITGIIIVVIGVAMISNF